MLTPYYFIMYVVLAIYIFTALLCNWRLFTKAALPGIFCVVPFLAQWKWFAISGFPGWLSLMPIVNVILYPIACVKLYRRFGLGWFLSIIGILIPLMPCMCIAFNPYIEYDF